MAEFTDILSEPSNSTRPTGGAAPGLATAGAALEGLADIVRIGLPILKEKQRGKRVGELSGDLTDLIAEFTGTADIREQVENQGAAALDTDPIVRAHSAQVGKLAQANNQGRMSREEFMTRASVLTQQSVQDNPSHATALRKVSQALLGFEPSSQLVALRSNEIAFEEQLGRQAFETNINAAVGKGVAIWRDDGSINAEATALVGQELLRDKATLDQIGTDLAQDKARADLTTAETEGQLKRRQFTGIRQAFLPTSNNMINSGLSSILQVVNNAPDGLDEEGETAFLQEKTGLLRAAFFNHFDQTISESTSNLDPEAINNAREFYENRFDTIDSIFVGPFSKLEVAKRQLETMNIGLEMDLIEAAPELARMRAAGGGRIPDSWAQNIIARLPELNKRAAQGLQAFFGGARVPDAAEATRTFNDYLEELKPIGSLTAPEKDLVVRGSLAAVQEIATNPALATQTEVNSWGMQIVQLSALALEGDSAEARAAAVHLSTPEQLAMLTKLSETDPARAESIGQAFRDIALVGAQETMRELKPVVKSGTTALPGGSQSRFTVQHQAFYNPATGTVEIETTEQVDDLTTALSSPQFRAASKQPAELVSQVNEINQQLNAVASLRGAGESQLSDLSDAQVRQLVADTGGIIPKPGSTPVDVPEGVFALSTAQQEQFAPDTDFDDTVEGTQKFLSNNIDILNEATRRGLMSGEEATGLVERKAIPDEDGTINRLLEESSATHQVDEALVKAVALVESDTGRQPVSPAGARGVMQLMPATAASLGVQDIDNPVENIDAGVRYLKQMLDRFGGDVRLALAAYNSGPTRVAKLGRVPRIKETQDYVKAVFDRMTEFKMARPQARPE